VSRHFIDLDSILEFDALIAVDASQMAAFRSSLIQASGS
jgi:hypothetical protein